MSFKLQHQDQTVVVFGELDRHHINGKRASYRPKLTADSQLDLAKVSTIDTAGLAWILKFVGHYKKQDLQISIINVPSQLIALAQISNVLALLPIED